jgi:hypothetical protein
MVGLIDIKHVSFFFCVLFRCSTKNAANLLTEALEILNNNLSISYSLICIIITYKLIRFFLIYSTKLFFTQGKYL